MKNLIISLAACLLLTLSYAQESKFTYGIFLSPEIQVLDVEGAPQLGSLYIKKHQGISAGLMGQYNFTPWLALESGLIFRNRTYYNQVSQILLPGGIDPWGNTTYTSIDDKVSYMGLTLPLSLVLTTGNGWGVQLGAGFDVWSNATRSRNVTEGQGDDPILMRWDSELSLNRLGFNFSFSKSIAIKNFRWEIGPQFSLTSHEIDIPYGYQSKRQYSIGLRSLFWFK